MTELLVNIMLALVFVIIGVISIFHDNGGYFLVSSFGLSAFFAITSIFIALMAKDAKNKN